LELEGSPTCHRRLMARRPRRAGRISTGAIDGALTREQLQSWLAQLAPPSRVAGLSTLDGYLTAIIIGPCSIPPDEWFVDLLGERGRIEAASGSTLAAIKAIASHFNVISQNLSLTPERHAPLFEKMDDGTVLAQPWCIGFLAAMQLRLQQWQPLRDLTRIDHGLLLPILLHCSDQSGRPMLGPPREGPDTEAFLRDAYHDIPLVLPQIRQFWMPQRLKER